IPRHRPSVFEMWKCGNVEIFVSLDPEPLDDLGKTLTGDAELDGGDAATATGTREGGADEAALEVQARLIESLCGAPGLVRDAGRQQADGDAAAPRPVHRERGDDVLQLAHVPRPVVARQRGDEIVAEHGAGADARS